MTPPPAAQSVDSRELTVERLVPPVRGRRRAVMRSLGSRCGAALASALMDFSNRAGGRSLP